MYDTSEESIGQRKLAEEKKTQERLDLVRAYKSTFKSAEGRKVLLDLMKQCHFTTTTLSSNIEFSEGRRSVVIDILVILEMSEEQILQFLYDRTEDMEDII